MKKPQERPCHVNPPTHRATVLPRAATVFFLALAAAVGAPSPESFVGTWAGKGEGMFKAKYQIKLTLAPDKTCVLEYTDREPPHSLNPYLKVNKIVVTGSWRVEHNAAEDRVSIDGTISEWSMTISPPGEKPSSSKVEPSPFADGLFFVISNDGTLQNPLITFKGKWMGMPVRVQPIAATLTNQNAQEQ